MATKTGSKKTEPRNAEVKALRAHSNQHGAKYAKAQGDTYVHPRPQADIDAGLVELVAEKPKKA
ncbi:hypothetical protein [Qipengyuania sp.]|uniref:hypothetical protein n=1 Tax=Qipengyuania sp. TaxID=2004515 RepID=UPI003515E562